MADMIVKDLDKYERFARKTRKWVKWHPWSQVCMWLSDYEAYNESAWSIKEAAAWVKTKLDENWKMVDEVNKNPLEKGLIYPDYLTGWVIYVIEDIIKFKWAKPEGNGNKYLLAIPCYAITYEWLACQLGGDVGAEMYRRGMYDASVDHWLHLLLSGRSMSRHRDIGYTKYWEKITGMRLCVIKFKTEGKDGQPSRIRYRER